ncbi:NADPH-adrenodoxin reductase [Mycoemilia scoparia]|uniref:NADPH-adrenodoxin reductase n=1 Tax=Mycoemilia scoparia TaxID=417184 RepID=A0A9W7ZV11_9FUNG|nr:NADPH-adrenodoxin reductase [Mycoemilia scoparia]
MSFNDLEAGYGRSIQQENSIDHEYRNAIKSLSQDIFLVNATRGQISKLVGFLGTNRDTPELRKKLHDKQDSTRELAKEVGSRLKGLSAFQESVDDGTRRKRRLEQEKLTKDFQKTLEDFQNIERLALTKTRKAIMSADEAVQQQERDRLNAEENVEEEQPLLDEQRQVQLQVFDNEIGYNEMLIRERENEIREIEQGIIELNTVFRDLGTIVTEQQSLFDNIESNVNNVKNHTNNASEQLTRASEHQKRSRKNAHTKSASIPHIAIVGGGPAGFYTAARLLSRVKAIAIDIYEKLPTPHGLVRYGVAPDHPEVKICMNKFDQVAEDERVRYFGNVEVGTDGLTLEKLRSIYSGVVLSFGASRDRKLGIPGEDGWRPTGSGADSRLEGGILSARDFVNWYNGHPTAQALAPDLESCDRAIIIGQGNVALDAARILLSDIDVLAKTDITENALDHLRKSKIRHVDVVGRRGPLQAAFTIKELREMIKLPNVAFSTDAELVDREIKEGAGLLAKSRPLKRMADLLSKHAAQSISEPPTTGMPSQDKRSWSLQFLLSPVKVTGNPNGHSPQMVVFEKNRLEGPSERPRAVGIGEYVELGCGLALRSVGYASMPMKGAPFDEKKMLVPNIGGRALKADGDVEPGLYVSGWLKRGPVGVIATTMQDAYQTADVVSSDISGGALTATTTNEVDSQLQKLDVMDGHVSYSGWKVLEDHEFNLGKAIGKPREKVTNVKDMLDIITNDYDSGLWFETEIISRLCKKSLPKNMKIAFGQAMSVERFYLNSRNTFALAKVRSTGKQVLVIGKASWELFITQLPVKLSNMLPNIRPSDVEILNIVSFDYEPEFTSFKQKIKEYNQEITRASKLKELKKYRDEAIETRKAKTHRYVSIDCEMWERNNNFILEIGWSIYDPQTDAILDYHHINSNALNLHNGRYVPDYKEGFLFGSSVRAPVSTTVDELKSLFKKLHPVIIVGHGVKGDIDLLKKAKLPFTDVNGFPIKIIDTSQLYMDYTSEPHNPTSVGNMCKNLGIETANLHNAGNDARFTLMAFLKLTQQ